ncbi:endoglucanase A isoform X2 [Cryptotermes secundus]|uniref:endoglucanase A isoform X2 n=1 Tax=Cryptotermes secundus TaxID=105785 RepID=UPI000CD7BBC9|nr:endoglucanase A isoform X2 [Cryptotermes secundus]
MRGFVYLLSALTVCRAYDYAQALRDSLLFYEAQRSGKLPPDQKVKWRKDSALNDKGQNGEDLTGGYYDSGDYVKFGFPMAFTSTILAWGLVDHEGGYIAANALDDARKAVRWATDYFIKAHVSPNEFYGQVGEVDHSIWCRPEDIPMHRPAYKIDTSHPGSDLASETAAALAAASIVFQRNDSSYADILLTHAKQLFDFANKYRGKYTESITGAKGSYETYSYYDELVWGATWLYRATGNESYLKIAEQLYKEFDLLYWTTGFTWDKKISGIEVLLARMLGKPLYKDRVISYCGTLVDSQKRTPKGLVYIEDYGSLSKIAAAAYICFQLADLGASSDFYRQFFKKQIDYILGDSGRSYVVGFGNNPPTHVRHRSRCERRNLITMRSLITGW